MNEDVASLLIEFVEHVARLRSEMQLREELDRYEGRIARIDAKLSKLADHLAETSRDLADALRSAWQLPTRSIARHDVTGRIEAFHETTGRLLIEFVEKVGLLRREMQHRKELDKYEDLVARIDGTLSNLAERLSDTNPDLTKALRSVWQLPARSLAFRNANHQKEMKKGSP